MVKLHVVCLYLFCTLYGKADAFSSHYQYARQPSTNRPGSYLMSTTEVDAVDTEKEQVMKRDRYVATNRFAVRRGQNVKFEKRWATRKSRLSTLPGFKYFHLMRRVQLQSDGTCAYDEGATDEEAQENYVSFTIWSKKSDFSAWRSGEAFKEAHGGTSIGAFLSTMVNSAMVLRGAPRPAFYDGLHLQSVKPESVPVTVDGWRSIEHDGITVLPAECFVEMTKYFVPPGQDALTFEQVWTNRDSALGNVHGFVGSSLLRRDGQAKGHGIVPVESTEPNFVAVTVFKDFTSFNDWSSNAETSRCNAKQETVFYEGTLVISSGTCL